MWGPKAFSSWLNLVEPIMGSCTVRNCEATRRSGMQVNLHEAKAKLSALVENAARVKR